MKINHTKRFESFLIIIVPVFHRFHKLLAVEFIHNIKFDLIYFYLSKYYYDIL